MTSGSFSNNGGQRGCQTQGGSVTHVLDVSLNWCSIDAVEFMIPLLCFRKLSRQVDLVKKRLKRDEERTNRVTAEKEQPVCSRPHVFLQR